MSGVVQNGRNQAEGSLRRTEVDADRHLQRILVEHCECVSSANRAEPAASAEFGCPSSFYDTRAWSTNHRVIGCEPLDTALIGLRPGCRLPIELYKAIHCESLDPRACEDAKFSAIARLYSEILECRTEMMEESAISRNESREVCGQEDAAMDDVEKQQTGDDGDVIMEDAKTNAEMGYETDPPSEAEKLLMDAAQGIDVQRDVEMEVEAEDRGPRSPANSEKSGDSDRCGWVRVRVDANMRVGSRRACGKGISARCAVCSLGMCPEHQFHQADTDCIICLHCHAENSRSSMPPASEIHFATMGNCGNGIRVAPGTMNRICSRCGRRRPVGFLCSHEDGINAPTVHLCDECSANGIVCQECQPEDARRQLIAAPMTLGFIEQMD